MDGQGVPKATGGKTVCLGCNATTGKENKYLMFIQNIVICQFFNSTTK